MDEPKLEKWKENFNKKARNIEIEFDAFFKDNKFINYYSFELDESDELSLKLSNELSQDFKEHLMKLLITTKPEDSI